MEKWIRKKRKSKVLHQAYIYVSIIAFSNGDLQALYDKSDGFYRRQLVIITKDKSPDRKDNPFIQVKKSGTQIYEHVPYTKMKRAIPRVDDLSHFFLKQKRLFLSYMKSNEFLEQNQNMYLRILTEAGLNRIRTTRNFCKD